MNINDETKATAISVKARTSYLLSVADAAAKVASDTAEYLYTLAAAPTACEANQNRSIKARHQAANSQKLPYRRHRQSHSILFLCRINAMLSELFGGTLRRSHNQMKTFPL